MHFGRYHLHLDLSSGCYGSLFIPAFSLKPGCFRHSIWALYWNSPPSASQIAAVLSPLLHDGRFSIHIIKHFVLRALGSSINSFLSYFFARLVLISRWDLLHPHRTCGVPNRGMANIYGFALYSKGDSLIHRRELGG